MSQFISVPGGSFFKASELTALVILKPDAENPQWRAVVWLGPINLGIPFPNEEELKKWTTAVRSTVQSAVK